MPSIMNAVAYRQGSRGFQQPNPAPTGRPASPVGRPANDNIKLPTPANDNKKAADVARRLGRLARTLGRLSPLGRALDALPLGNLEMWQQEVPGQDAGYPQLEAWASSSGFKCYCPDPLDGTARQHVVTSTFDDFGAASNCNAFWPQFMDCAGPIPYDVEFGDPIPVPAAASGTRAWVGIGPDPAGTVPNTRVRVYESFWSPVGPQTGFTAAFQPAVAPVAPVYFPPVIPASNPTVDPLGLPIQVPVPSPSPVSIPLLPRLRPNPNRNKNEQRQVGNVEPDVPHPPRPDPRLAGGVAVSRGAGAAPVPQPRSAAAPRYPQRPPEGTKERKTQGLTGLGMAVTQAGQKAMHGYTEFRDLVRAFHDALPERNQSKSKRVDNMLGALWNNWQNVDMGAALGNVVLNELGDRIAGRAIGAGSRQARRMGVTLGPAGYGYIPGR